MNLLDIIHGDKQINDVERSIEAKMFIFDFKTTTRCFWI